VDKEPYVKNVAFPLLRNSILFDQTSEQWKHKRRAMTPAFYKDKLRGLINIAA